MWAFVHAIPCEGRLCVLTAQPCFIAGLHRFLCSAKVGPPAPHSTAPAAKAFDMKSNAVSAIYSAILRPADLCLCVGQLIAFLLCPGRHSGVRNSRTWGNGRSAHINALSRKFCCGGRQTGGEHVRSLVQWARSVSSVSPHASNWEWAPKAALFSLSASSERREGAQRGTGTSACQCLKKRRHSASAPGAVPRGATRLFKPAIFEPNN